MNNLIFMDVGANTGQSLQAALLYKFDFIYTFEPVKKFYEELETVPPGYFGGQVVHNNFGLFNQTATLPIYGPVDLAASLFQDHQDVKDGMETCSFVEVSPWMRANLKYGDIVVMKLNCEGAEVDIMNNLLESDLLRFMYNVMIDLDAAKIPSRHKDIPPLVEQLKRYPNISWCDQVMHGPTHKDRICNWLDKIGVLRA